MKEALTEADFSHLSLERVLKELELLFATPINPALFPLLRNYPIFKLLNLEVEIGEELPEQAEELEAYLAELSEKNYNIEEWVLRTALFFADAGEEISGWKLRSDYKDIFLGLL